MTNHEEVRRPPYEQTLLSVVLPVYNEAKVLHTLVARIATVLSSCARHYEIVLVDDGSRDESPQILDHLAAAATGRPRRRPAAAPQLKSHGRG